MTIFDDAVQAAHDWACTALDDAEHDGRVFAAALTDAQNRARNARLEITRIGKIAEAGKIPLATPAPKYRDDNYWHNRSTVTGEKVF
jgi:hypothetical protein